MTDYLTECARMTAEEIARSRAADEIVMAVRDGTMKLDSSTAFTLLAVLASGRIAARERQELREINAELRAKVSP